MNQTLRQAIQDVIQSDTINELLQHIAQGCETEAQHKRDQFQDERSARKWEKRARRINALATKTNEAP